MELTAIVQDLKSLSDPKKAKFKAEKFNIPAKHALGLYMSDLNQMAKTIGANRELAEALFQQEIYETKLLTSKIFPPNSLTISHVAHWVQAFNTWEICDSFSMTVFARSPIAHQIIEQYRNHTEEMVKRTSYATLAGLCSFDKESENSIFEQYYPMLTEAASDERNFVKKAVSWAARSIGKRNPDLKESTTQWAAALPDNKSAQWIANDVIKELTSDNVRVSNYPRRKYGR